ncbi:FRIGIDA-like protein 4b [Bienertia sinuspersici]
MATTDIITNNKVESLFENLEAQKSLLTKCTDLYKTLTSHFTTLQQSIDSKTLTLDSDLKSSNSLYQKSLDDLDERESLIPNKLSSLYSEIESKKQSAIAELDKPVNENAPFPEVIKSLCRRMDHVQLQSFMISKRKETNSLRGEMREALKECVDPPRMVLESIKEFVDAKAKGKRGVADRRWACGVVVNGLFPLEELKKKDNVGPAFARKTVKEAEVVLRDWRAKAKEAGGEGGGSGSSMGSAEAVLFLQVVVGFGLKEMIEEEYCKNLMMEFAGRRDMAKLADEANKFEISYIRSIIRCVEDHKLESEFSVDSLKKQLSALDKAKADKKKGSASNSKPSNKRAHGSGAPPRNSGAHPPRPAKTRKFQSSYPHLIVSQRQSHGLLALYRNI